MDTETSKNTEVQGIIADVLGAVVTDEQTEQLITQLHSHGWKHSEDPPSFTPPF